EVSPLNGLKFIAVGAGFQGDIPKSCQIIWLRRPTDGDGRIFPDRPRLEPNMDPMAEYQHRYQSRDERFRQVYDRMLTIPEGWESINDFEPRLMGLLPSKAGMSFTLLPEHVARPRRLDVLLQDLPLLGVKFIELRTDLLET